MATRSASMIVRQPLARPIPTFLLPFASQISSQKRCLHRENAPKIPPPTPFVPDTQTFLSLIGRNLSQHASKFTKWSELFTSSSEKLKELGIEPPRSRRYLLRWREKFRRGEFGIGGDIEYIEDGKAMFRIVEVPCTHSIATATNTPGMRKIIVNTPANSDPSNIPPEDLKPVKGLKIKNARIITGPYVQPVKGDRMAARIVVQEGMWEDRRGHKIDGGERRWAEVRAKKRSEERKAR